MRRFLGRWLIPLVLVVWLPTVVAVPETVQAAEADGEDHEKKGEDVVPGGFQTDLALWSLVVFIVFVTVLKKFAWGPLAEGLDSRESRIRQDIADAEAARQKAEKMLAEHAAKLDAVQDEVREILAEARRDAEHTKQEITTAAQAEAEASRDRAVDQINRAKDQALDELFGMMAGQVANATEFVLGRSLNDDDQSRLIEESLSQFPGRNGE